MCLRRVGSAPTRRRVAPAGVLLLKGGAGTGPRVKHNEPSVERNELRWALCVGRVGGAHTRRRVATVGVLLLKGGAGLAPSRAK